MSDVIQTRTGAVRGLVEEAGRRFMGIPFAAPPVGPLRWRAPQPVAPWDGVRDATAPGAPCIQRHPGTHEIFGDEDCLYLNVTTPPADHRSARPVMVWFHGGSWTQGAGSDYDTRDIVAQGDVVVVTVNYRLHLLGFFAHPAFDEGDHTGGDCALEDQQAALRWVRDNIAAFGGDPDNVTIFGESAGGRSVLLQLMSPSARGLFHRAIDQSGPGLSDHPPGSYGPTAPERIEETVTRDKAHARGQRIADALGATDGEALRALPAEALLAPEAMAAAGSMNIVRGGSILPLDWDTRFDAGDFNRVPIIAGTCRDEHTLFVLLAFEFLRIAGVGEGITDDNYGALLEQAFGADAAAVSAAYPRASYASAAHAYAAVMGDRIWCVPTLDLVARAGRFVPTWLYQFADETAPSLFAALMPGVEVMDLGAYHGSEIGFLFPAVVPALGLPDLTQAQAALGRAMTGYWTRFAHGGDPNGEGAFVWAPFDPSRFNALRFADGPEPLSEIDYAAAHKAAFWRAL